jgi:hypothetical protein
VHLVNGSDFDGFWVFFDGFWVFFDGFWVFFGGFWVFFKRIFGVLKVVLLF